jgi:hypothetical protein
MRLILVEEEHRTENPGVAGSIPALPIGLRQVSLTPFPKRLTFIPVERRFRIRPEGKAVSLLVRPSFVDTTSDEEG